MKVRNHKNGGITLIALVITIIVLLILAGVSIAMLTGPNGLLTQADEARTETDMAGAREKVQLAILGSYGEDGTLDPVELEKNLQGIPGADVGEQNIQEENLNVEVDGYTFEITKEGEVKDIGTVTPTPPEIDEVIPGVIVEGSNKKYTDEDGDIAVIPVGFAIVPNLDNVSEGLVISDKANDIADEGNQFVWIPVNSNYEATTTYEDKNISSNRQNDIGYLPLTDAEIGIGENTDDEQKRQLTLNKETDLVTTNMLEKYEVKGFYTSRYEAGDGSTSTERTEDSGITGELVSKKDAYVYNNIKQTEAKEKAKTFKVKDNTKVKSGLCTGIQWDMIMNFIKKEERLDGTSQPYNVETSSASRHRNVVEQSGQNLADKVCNIYDLEGNCYDYVAEKNTYSTETPYVHRGGSIDYRVFSASDCRNNNGDASIYDSFRITLYVM